MNKIHSIIRGLLDMKLDSSNDDFEKIKRLLSHFDLWFCLYLISKEDKDAESFEEHKTIKFNEKRIKREASYHHLISAAAAWLAILY